MFRELRAKVGDRRGVVWSAHCHNDLGLAVANSLAAVEAGARQVECTINGIGERAGNAAMEEIAVALAVRPDRYKTGTRLRLQELYATSRLLSEITGVSVPPNKAVVGANAFAHEAGIHQDGILKNPLTYQVISPEAVGVPAHKLVLGKHSGRNALRARLAELGVIISEDELRECYRQVMALADTKKEITDEDIKRVAGRLAADARRLGRGGMSQPSWNIAVLPGDGIGPEVIRAATSILQDCAGEFGFHVNLVEFPFGGNAIDKCGKPLPQETLDGCLKADAVLLGAVGGPKWDSQPLDRRPEAGLLGLRQALGVYANVRPIQLRKPLRALCPLRLNPDAEDRFRDHSRTRRRYLFWRCIRPRARARTNAPRTWRATACRRSSASRDLRSRGRGSGRGG